MSSADNFPNEDLRLSDAERLAWLRLIRSENIGPVTFHELLTHFGSAEAAIDGVPELATRGGRAIRLCSEEAAEREVDTLGDNGARLVAMNESDYPQWLRHTDGAPPLLSVRGDVAILSRPTIAIVGSRNASIAGIKFARQIARDLGQHGYAIASGLARGIDAAAHHASLSSGTIAVFAGGLDRIYPTDNLDLAESIVAEGGAQTTEMPLGWQARARDFPRRNRIVSGVALGVVVIEAAERSGSLITARLANEQGRAVFAVPGSPLDPRAAGTNRLIRDGARILTGVEDIVEEIKPMLTNTTQAPARFEESEPDALPALGEADDSERARIVDGLGTAPVELDEIVRFTGLTPAIVHLVLLELDLAGRIERHSGGRISLVPTET
jgi:DNA processing protein